MSEPRMSKPLMESMEGNAVVLVGIPAGLVSALRNEYKVKSNKEVGALIASIVEKSIMEHATASNEVYTKEQTMELEDDLKGLGYI